MKAAAFANDDKTEMLRTRKIARGADADVIVFLTTRCVDVQQEIVARLTIFRVASVCVCAAVRVSAAHDSMANLAAPPHSTGHRIRQTHKSFVQLESTIIIINIDQHKYVYLEKQYLAACPFVSAIRTFAHRIFAIIIQ